MSDSDVTPVAPFRVVTPNETVNSTPPVAEEITVQQLIDRCAAHATNFGPNSKTRLILFNVIRALTELTIRLDLANKQMVEMKKAFDEAKKPGLIVLPPKEGR